MGNNSDKGIRDDLPHTEADTKPQLNHFGSSFVRLVAISEANNGHQQLDTNTLLDIFPPDLNHVGVAFIHFIVGKCEPAPDCLPCEAPSDVTSKVIGDSVNVPASANDYTSLTSHDNPAEGGVIKFGTSFISEKAFICACESILALKDALQKTQFYTSLCNRSCAKVTLTDCESLLVTCSSPSLINHSISQTSQLDRKMTNTLAAHILKGRVEVNAEELHGWMSTNHLFIFDSLHDWLIHTLKHPKTDRTLEPSSNKLSHILCWLLTMLLPESYFTTNITDYLPSLSTTQKKYVMMDGWEVLYDSDDHGLSINRFDHHISSYNAPSVMVVITDSLVFCVACMTEWRKASGKFGGSQSSFMQISPTISIVQDNDLLKWVDRPRDPHRGITIHKTGSSSPLAFIPHDFSTVRFYGVDYTIQHLQVFGCGDESARDKQLKQKEWEKREVNKIQQQKLHLEQNWEENADKKILEMAGIRTEHSQR